MKAFTRAIAIFCRKHPNFGIPKMMLAIVLISGLVSLILTPTIRYMVFDVPSIIFGFQVWRLITWIFIVPTSGGMGMFFTLITLYFYYFIGSTLEREWGSGRFTIYYLLGMLLHIIYGFVVYLVNGARIYLDPMFLNLSMFFAFAVLFPDYTVRLFFIIPIKIKWLALANAAFFLYMIISALIAGQYLFALMPVVAVANFLLMCGEDLGAYIRRFTNSAKRKASPQVINFRKAAKEAKRDMDNRTYRHKCAVCGITDTESPETEFRYCSRCSGYHCFCAEHINNHVHFH